MCKVVESIFKRRRSKTFSLLKAASQVTQNYSFLKSFSKHEFSVKELLSFVNRWNHSANRPRLENSKRKSYSNISININFNKNPDLSSRDPDSPRFKVSASGSCLSECSVGIPQLADLSLRKESLPTSKSSSSSENGKKIKMILLGIKRKLFLMGISMLKNTVSNGIILRERNGFWKLRQSMNFKLAVHGRILRHISKKIYVSRFLKLTHQ